MRWWIGLGGIGVENNSNKTHHSPSSLCSTIPGVTERVGQYIYRNQHCTHVLSQNIWENECAVFAGAQVPRNSSYSLSWSNIKRFDHRHIPLYGWTWNKWRTISLYEWKCKILLHKTWWRWFQWTELRHLTSRGWLHWTEGITYHLTSNNKCKLFL